MVYTKVAVINIIYSFLVDSSFMFGHLELFLLFSQIQNFKLQNFQITSVRNVSSNHLIYPRINCRRLPGPVKRQRIRISHHRRATTRTRAYRTGRLCRFRLGEAGQKPFPETCRRVKLKPRAGETASRTTYPRPSSARQPACSGRHPARRCATAFSRSASARVHADPQSRALLHLSASRH